MKSSEVVKAKSFVYTTVKNLCLDSIKHQKIEKKYTSLQLQEAESQNFLHEITYQKTLRLLYEAILELSPQTREVILQGLEGKTTTK